MSFAQMLPWGFFEEEQVSLKPISEALQRRLWAQRVGKRTCRCCMPEQWLLRRNVAQQYAHAVARETRKMLKRRKLVPLPEQGKVLV